MHLDSPTIFYRTTFPIDLFSFYVLFSLSDHVMSTPENCSFKCRLMHMHPRAYVCIINEKTKGKRQIPPRTSRGLKPNVNLKRSIKGLFAWRWGIPGR